MTTPTEPAQSVGVVNHTNSGRSCVPIHRPRVVIGTPVVTDESSSVTAGSAGHDRASTRVPALH